MIIRVNTIHFKSKLVRLLETFECHMIAEIRKKIDKEATLATAERVRVESNLATDLWKRPVSSGLVDACSDNCTTSVICYSVDPSLFFSVGFSSCTFFIIPPYGCKYFL